jgi:hypothetical protein
VKSKIVATTRARNEAKNIAYFCNAYKFADKILIADGGSEDNTVQIANCYPNVEVRQFEEKIYSSSGDWRNPRGSHQNFLIDWAEEEGADWMILDDTDCLPNMYLREDYHSIMRNNPKKDFIYATRLYIWGYDKYFPKLAKPKGDWTPSLWAWRLESGFRFKEDNPWLLEFGFEPEKHKILNLETPPYCLLHYPWKTEEDVQRKMHFYNSMPETHNLEHPLEAFGKLEDLPDWAIL